MLSTGWWVVISIVVTGIVTWGITKHFQKRSLGIYLDFGTSVFEGVDPEIQEEVALMYDGFPVEDLYHLEFLVVNNGRQPIPEPNQRFTMALPEGVGILDTTVVDRSSSNLDVEVTGVSLDEQETQAIAAEFPFLNPGDWFKVKALLHNTVDPEELTCEIRAPGLSSEIPLTTKDEYYKYPRWVTIGAFIVGIIASAAIADLWVGDVIAQTEIGNWTAVIMVSASIGGAFIFFVVTATAVSLVQRLREYRLPELPF